MAELTATTPTSVVTARQIAEHLGKPQTTVSDLIRKLTRDHGLTPAITLRTTTRGRPPAHYDLDDFFTAYRAHLRARRSSKNNPKED